MDDALKKQLTDLGLDDKQIAKLEKDSGATTAEDLAMLSDTEIVTYSGCTPIAAKKVVAAVKPAEEIADPSAELKEGEKPSAAQVNGLASELGVGSDLMTMMLLGNGLSAGIGEDMGGISGLIPIARVVEGYNPKVRNLYMTLMGQIQSAHGVPIVVINDDGSTNKELTVQYVEGLDEGFDPADDNVYYDGDGTPYEVIKVGIDAQSTYKADPLNPEKPLQKSGQGMGRINWSKAPIEVMQVVFYAVTKTGEIDPGDVGQQTWLRDTIAAGATKMKLAGIAPKAITEYNEAARTGSLPSLLVTPSRGPRKKEMMPRRRTGIGRDVSSRRPVNDSMTARSYGGDD